MDITNLTFSASQQRVKVLMLFLAHEAGLVWGLALESIDKGDLGGGVE